MLVERLVEADVKSTQVRVQFASGRLDPLPLLVIICSTVRIFLGVVWISIPRLFANCMGSS